MRDFKIILFGGYGVGKTSLTIRLLYKEFNDNATSTIGASFMTWRPEFITGKQKKIANFGVWDTAGQERFSLLLPLYLRDADAVFYCWDYNTPFDVSEADKMYNQAKEYSPDCLFYLVHTKIDRNNDENIKCKIAEEWVAAKELEGHYYTSSFTGKGVNELFSDSAKSLIDKPRPEEKLKPIELGEQRNCCF